ncbi:MAG: hypothetical protein PHR16_09935 [Methylovulum sp.]|nr:hypothetical protein [Methylovulum sp.]
MTTLYSYGKVQQHRQGEILQPLKMSRVSNSQNVDEFARAILKTLASQNLHSGA